MMSSVGARRCAAVFMLVLGALGGATAGAGAAGPAPLLRVIHASSDAPAIDVYVNNQLVATAPAFAAATPYTAVAAGSAHVRVLAAGAGPSGPAYLGADLDLREGGVYTLIAADTVGRMAPVILNDTSTVPTDGLAHLRLVHVSPDAPPVADVAVAGGPVVARGLPFKGATGYLTVTPGTYAFDIRAAGTVQALATTPALALEADHSYSAVVMGQLGDGSFRAVVVADNAANSGIGGMPTAGGGGMAAAATQAPARALPVPVGVALACAGPLVILSTLLFRRARVARN